MARTSDARRWTLVVMSMTVCMSHQAAAAGRMRFWNLTSNTVTSVSLAPTGTGRFGPDQCKSDKDGTVDPDERLSLENVAPGRYDVRLGDKEGRVCTVRNVEVKGDAPYAFSISDADLTDCSP